MCATQSSHLLFRASSILRCGRWVRVYLCHWRRTKLTAIDTSTCMLYVSRTHSSWPFVVARGAVHGIPYAKCHIFPQNFSLKNMCNFENWMVYPIRYGTKRKEEREAGCMRCVLSPVSLLRNEDSTTLCVVWCACAWCVHHLYDGRTQYGDMAIFSVVAAVVVGSLIVYFICARRDKNSER